MSPARLSIAVTAGLLASAPPALAQASDPHVGHHMHRAAPAATTTGLQPATEPSTPPVDPGTPATGGDAELTGTDQPPGSAEPPATVHDNPAAQYWNPAAMAASAEAEMHPPSPVYSKLIFDAAELRIREGRDGYRWEGEFWAGNVDRFVIKTRGEGTRGEGLESGEVQALYAKALDPWWNLQAGIRQDIGPHPHRTWATVGLDGRARYQFDVQGALFLSDKGQFAARLEGSYDLRITQRLVFQPRTELELSAQDMPAERIGSGLSKAELDLRLRYDVRRELSPYIGVNWTWAAGKTAQYARADGKEPVERSVIAGVRFWF